MPRRWPAVTGILVTSFLAALDTFAVGPAMPTVVADLGSLKLQFLVFCSFSTASTVMVPIWGRLSDIYGRLRLLVAGIVIFLIGSTLCGLSQTMIQLILFRGVQGIGAGALMTLGFTMLSDMYPIRQRARIGGLASAVWGLASIVGPIVGGAITHAFSWRYVFFINLPIGIVATALVILTWRFEPKRHPSHQFDLIGGVCFILGMTLMLLVLALVGQRRYAWSDTLMLGGMTASLTLIALMLRLESRHPEPFVDLKLLRTPTFRTASFVRFFITMCLFGISAYGPMFVQGVVGTDSRWAGLALVPMSLCWVTGSVLSGFLLARTGFRTLSVAGTLSIGAGYLLMLRLDPGSSWAAAAFSFAPVGLGLGCSLLSLLLGVQHSVPKHQIGAATALIQFLSTTGGSFGLALMGVAFGTTLHPFEAKTGVSAETLIRIDEAVAPDAAREALLKEGLSEAIHSVYAIGLLAAGIACLAAFMIPRGSANEFRASMQKKTSPEESSDSCG